MAMNNIYKWATVAGIGGGAYQFYNMGATKVITQYGDIPIWLVGAGMAVSGSLTADILNQWLTPEISSNDRLKTVNGALVDLGASAGGFMAGAKLIRSDLIEQSGGMMKMASLGMGVHVISNYIYNNYVAPLVGDENRWNANF